MGYRVGSWTIAAAFATERDAFYSASLLSSVTDAAVTYSIRPVLGEDGSVSLVVLEATFEDPDLVSHFETIIAGTHGISVPPAAGLPAAISPVAA